MTQTIPVNQTLDTYDFGGAGRNIPKGDKSIDLYGKYKTGSGILIPSDKPEASRNNLNEHPVMQKSISDVNISLKHRAAYPNKESYQDGNFIVAARAEKYTTKKNRLGVEMRRSH